MFGYGNNQQGRWARLASSRGSRWIAIMLLISVAGVAMLNPRSTAPDAARLPRPYFEEEQSYFARGNFIDLDSEPTVSQVASALEAPEQFWTVAGTNTVSLNWTREPEAKSYVVRYRPITQNAYQSAEVSAPFFTVRNARADTTYEFAVASKNEEGVSSDFGPRTAVTPTALTSTTKIERHDFEVGAWLPPGWENQDVQDSFERASGTLSTINPFWYNFSKEGKLEAKGSAQNPEVVARAHQSGIKVIITITNNFDPKRVSMFLKDSKLQEQFIKDVLTQLTQFDYDGVDLDFENVHATDKDAFTEFVLRLADAVHAEGKLIELTAQAKKSDNDTWDGPGAIDLERLADSIDRFKPMLYDFARPDTEPGPLAPLAWITEVLNYWKSKVPAQKIQAALPLYGYDWSLNTDDDIGIQWKDAQHIKNKYSTEGGVDTSSGEPFLKYSDEHGPRIVFYQDAEAVAKKVAAVRAAGVGAVTFWLLGGEDPQNFAALRAATSSTTVTIQKPLNIGLKVKGDQVAVSLSKFPEVDHVTVLYGDKPNTLTQKLEKQTVSLISLPTLKPGETRYVQAIAYDKKGNEIKKSGLAFISLESINE